MTLKDVEYVKNQFNEFKLIISQCFREFTSFIDVIQNLIIELLNESDREKIIDLVKQIEQDVKIFTITLIEKVSKTNLNQEIEIKLLRKLYHILRYIIMATLWHVRYKFKLDELHDTIWRMDLFWSCMDRYMDNTDKVIHGDVKYDKSWVSEILNCYSRFKLL